MLIIKIYNIVWESVVICNSKNKLHKIIFWCCKCWGVQCALTDFHCIKIFCYSYVQSLAFPSLPMFWGSYCSNKIFLSSVSKCHLLDTVSWLFLSSFALNHVVIISFRLSSKLKTHVYWSSDELLDLLVGVRLYYYKFKKFQFFHHCPKFLKPVVWNFWFVHGICYIMAKTA